MAQRNSYRGDYGIATERRPRRARREQAEQKKRPPLLLRLLSWFGVILLCFVLGYLATSWLMDSLNRKLLLKPENRIENQEDLEALNETEKARAEAVPQNGGSVQQVAMTLYYVQGDTIAETRQNFVARTQEDNIGDALAAIFSLSGVPDADRIEVLHVFRNGDTVFLDLSQPFVTALSSMGQRQSLLLLTGIVRTIQEKLSPNFSSVIQVRFLIDSKAPASGGTVDLSVPWKMPSRS